MRNLILALAIAFSFHSSCRADPPAVPATLAATVGDEVRLEVKLAAGKEAGFLAAFDDADCFFDRLWSDDPAVMRFYVRPKRAGTFRVVFWTVGEKRGAAAAIIATAPEPPPLPPPPPAPPVPPPRAEKLWIIVVDDTAHRSPAAAQVLGDLAFWKSLEPLGHKWHIFDQSEAEARDKGYTAAAAKCGGAPALLLLDPAGKLLRAAKLPDSTDAVRSLVQETTGQARTGK
jgi:hypothetical protein